mmetsp:Transcript_28661/g.58616  ORF Transcript_28661/g.58616 Transcript_28661/m.58616 type:complete len:327 (+) Transcript_28661:63-1043(+)|eukprot:CAMPEP_0181289456 /NCGR_PEP_ID=MMETSP1101-20121128/890_1 /TAXON_ID=46948 /ORGANISM="Rhodomonas abbreviata, Strain Caron Lab Isolate" /LENGTH=326 /DNA_ID=CAMNT_0023393675 /DNA_START=58 /DNA_END=1038 /DNA_ORIENTATION=+
MSAAGGQRFDLSKPRESQETYWGRVKHFFDVTDPRTILATDKELDAAHDLVMAYKAGKEPPGVTEDEIWAAKKLYDSAFHPQTGEKNFFLGRMSCQVPGNMLITGGMMAFYKSNPAQLFFQWANQTFNAVVNYTNRNASSHITNEMLATAYVSATGASCVVAVGLNKMIAKSPALSNGIVGRFVPLIAVASANCINIPLMRQVEMKEGINVHTKEGQIIGQSKEAAVAAVCQVIPSRILMACPSMGLTPVVMNFLDARGVLAAFPWLNIPATLTVTGLALAFSTPLCCAIFPQEAAMDVSRLDPELQAKVKELCPTAKTLYYNKGL